jgi:hypothetical protein
MQKSVPFLYTNNEQWDMTFKAHNFAVTKIETFRYNLNKIYMCIDVRKNIKL